MKKNGKFQKVKICLLELAEIYSTKHIPRGAAALSYCLVLSIFPVLICLHAILVWVVPGMELSLESFNGVIPESALKVILDYLEYVSTHNNSTMVTAGILGTITTSAASFRTIQGIMADIQGESRFHGILNLIFSFVFSLIFLVTIYFGVIVMVSGNWLMGYLAEAFPVLERIALWQLLKYPILFVIFILIIYLLYRITAPRGTKEAVMPGAILAAVLLVIVSYFFSIFINVSTRYPLIYGSLASIIICMLWLYACGLILILCNAVNFVVRSHRDDEVLEINAISPQEKAPEEPPGVETSKPERKRRVRFNNTKDGDDGGGERPG